LGSVGQYTLEWLNPSRLRDWVTAVSELPPRELFSVVVGSNVGRLNDYARRLLRSKVGSAQSPLSEARLKHEALKKLRDAR
jgi:hypothetical protein